MECLSLLNLLYPLVVVGDGGDNIHSRRHFYTIPKSEFYQYLSVRHTY